MAINTTIGTPTPGSDPLVIASRITLQISNPDTNTILAVGVGVSAEAAITSLNRIKLSRQRLIAELQPQLNDLKAELAALDPNAASYEKRKASREAEIASYEKKIANANSDISAADEAIAYINSEYQTAIDQRVKEATQPAPVAVATPDSAAGESGNSENPPPAEATTSPVPNPNITANQESINEQDTYAEAQRKAAAAEAATQSSIEAGAKVANTDPSAVRLEAAGVAAGAKPPSKNPAAPSVSLGGVKKEDMRVRIALAPQSPNIFYKDPKNDLLKPLKETDGVIFPIQPSITIGHEARYQSTDLTHSNFTFFNYQNSAVKPISLTGEFLIRNPREGRYCIAVIRFLQAMTKMFNANDTANNMKGAPPAVARLYGLGLMGFDSIPVVITSVDVTYGTDVDLLSLAVAVNGTTEVTKLPASFQITVTMNPVFSREFATNFFGTQDYASGKVRLLGKQVITPIVTTTPATTTPAAKTNETGNVATANSNTTNSNMAEPDSNVGTSGNSAGDGDGVNPAATGSGTDSKNEVTKEKTTTRNNDGSTTEVTTETVNGVTKVTTTNIDASGKSTTTVGGGSSGTGADSASTNANATGNGGDSTQPKDEAAAASSIAAKKQATDDFIAQRDQIISQVQSAYDGIKQAITDYSATYLAMLNRNQASHQADLAKDQAELAAVQNGTMTFPTPGGFTSIAEIQQSIASEQKDIARRQANIDAGAPYYGLTQDQFNLAASTEPAYLSAKNSASSALNSLGTLTSTRQSSVDFAALPSYSASWYSVPPAITINGKNLT